MLIAICRESLIAFYACGVAWEPAFLFRMSAEIIPLGHHAQFRRRQLTKCCTVLEFSATDTRKNLSMSVVDGSGGSPVQFIDIAVTDNALVEVGGRRRRVNQKQLEFATHGMEMKAH
jgi:hypothetical protein